MSIISASVLKAFQNKQANDAVIMEVKTLENYVESLPEGTDERLEGENHVAATVSGMAMRNGMNKVSDGFKSIRNTLRLKGDPNQETINQLFELINTEVKTLNDWVSNPAARKTEDVDIETVVGAEARAFMDKKLRKVG
mgnify:CR=1 FL=1